MTDSAAASPADLTHPPRPPRHLSSGDPFGRLFPPVTAPLNLAHTRFPPPVRPTARLSVLDITKYFGEATGGIRTYLLEKARYVESREGLRQVLVVPGGADALTESDGVRCYRLRGPRIPTQDTYRFLLATRTTRRILEHERPDLIEVGSPFVVPWLTRHANRRARAPMVWFYHTNLPRIIAPEPRHTGRLRGAAGALAWRYVRRLNRLFRATFAASDSVAADLERAGLERVVRVSLGVDLVRFRPDRSERRPETRRRAGLSDAPLGIFVGRFAREKQLDLLLAAWREVHRRTGAVLALVGDGPQRERLAAAAPHGSVRWLPYATDREWLADLLAAADLYVAPGPAETFGLSALEAMASGLPVLSVAQGAVADHVRASGAGALYSCGQAGELAEAAVELIRGDLAPLGRRARQHAERHHAWPVVFDRLFAAYRQVLAEPR